MKKIALVTIAYILGTSVAWAGGLYEYGGPNCCTSWTGVYFGAYFGAGQGDAGTAYKSREEGSSTSKTTYYSGGQPNYSYSSTSQYSATSAGPLTGDITGSTVELSGGIAIPAWRAT